MKTKETYMVTIPDNAGKKKNKPSITKVTIKGLLELANRAKASDSEEIIKAVRFIYAYQDYMNSEIYAVRKAKGKAAKTKSLAKKAK